VSGGPLAAAPTVPGPGLGVLTQHLAAASPDLLDPAVDALAVLGDTLVDTCAVVLPAASRTGLRSELGTTPDARAATALGCWLAREPGLLAVLAPLPTATGAGSRDALLVGAVRSLVRDLAPVLPPSRWASDPAAREEVVRAFLLALRLSPAGESEAVALDRWTAISTAARQAAEREIAQEARRTAEIARRLAEKRAKEAVAQYTHV
jgi:hypothetical protein